MTRHQPPSDAPRADTPSAPVAFTREATHGGIEVSSAQIHPGSAIPSRHTAYGDGVSPALQWRPVGGALSYVLLVEDPDAPTPRPFVHWLAWNIPPGVQALPEGIEATARPAAVRGMCQGRNDRDGLGYFGPRPPQGDAPHHYHFQLFALDRTLALPEGADRDDVLNAIEGHVVAKGQLVATSKAPASQ